MISYLIQPGICRDENLLYEVVYIIRIGDLSGNTAIHRASVSVDEACEGMMIAGYGSLNQFTNCSMQSAFSGKGGLLYKDAPQS